MPLLVRVETEGGQVLGSTSDVQDVLLKLAKGRSAAQLAVARMIDPLGMTVFNRLQIPLLLQDLKTLRESANKEELEVLAAVAGLASRAQEEPHLYLKVYGD